ncbi:UDP-N-acetylmuramate dehydrogenase [Vibrio navarrensis]|uniref:UDP-N-acetylmuramate dehydrogenase n=1 Tax=Vibrio navarrensis TaxID=29495 RepID=UPI001558E6B1|nr:UDP-N-acetylmuramate dehydrogenase [Vibrio navarrensis]
MISNKTLTCLKLKGLGEIYEKADLSALSYWRIGGRADIFIPRNEVDLVKAIKLIKESNSKYTVLGKTSNILFTDDDIDGIILLLGDGFNHFKDLGKGEFEVGASYSVPWLTYKTGSRGWTGIEHCIGIPGSLGGLIYMNGGSNRKAIGDNVISVNAIDINKNCIVTIEHDDCNFSYRNSIFQSGDYIILSAKLKLSEKSARANKNEMLSILRIRRSKFPLNLPSCGSVFQSKSDVYEKYGPPGKILEEMGFKKLSVGGVEVSDKHANFIVNRGGATASDVINLVRIIRKKVHDELNVLLPTEVNFVSKSLDVVPLSEYLDSGNQR